MILRGRLKVLSEPSVISEIFHFPLWMFHHLLRDTFFLRTRPERSVFTSLIHDVSDLKSML